MLNATLSSIDSSAFIHQLALVSQSEVGRMTKVWQFASIIRGARVGAHCTIGSSALVDGAEVGDFCLVGHGAAIEPGVRLRDKVFVGPGVVFCNDAWPRTDKGDFSVAQFLEDGRVTILVEEGASIGARAVILPGVVVGSLAMVAAGAVVSRSVPPRHVWKRNGDCMPIEARPARRMKLLSPAAVKIAV